MAINKDNLKGNGFDEIAAEKQREIASMGGKASAEARRAKRDLRQALEILLERNIKTKDGIEMTGTEAITAKLFEQALKGNIKAFETLRDTVGQKPVEKVMIAEVEQSVIDEVERMVLNDENTSNTISAE